MRWIGLAVIVAVNFVLTPLAAEMTAPGGRSILVFALACATIAGVAPGSESAKEVVQVESWTRQRLNSTGVPETWRAYETIGGHPAYDFIIVEERDGRALRMRSNGDHSTIAKEVQVDLKTTPWLEWSWKVVALPDRADIRRRETSDAAAHIFVIWPRWPTMLRSRLIGYLWDEHLPVGSIHQSQKTGTVTFIVVHSGKKELGAWLTERRNVREDYLMVYGEEPENPPVIALSIDTNDTKSSAETFIGPIGFRGDRR
jgi:DUF3047 family protein